MLLLISGGSPARGADAAGDPPLAKIIEKTLAPCPTASGDDIVVCAERRARAQARYRLPIRPDGFDPAGATDSVSRERHRLYQVGDTGTGSCSASGAGGWTGCQSREWRARREQYGK